MKRIYRFLAQRSGMCALVVVMSAAIPARFLPDLRLDNSIETWVPQKSEAYRDYLKFVERYGSDEFIVVGLEIPDPFADVALQRQRELAAKLRAVSGVDGVWDLPALARELHGDAAGWKENAAKDAFLQHSVLGVDGHTAGMFIWLKPLQGPDARRVLMRDINAAITAFQSNEFKTHLAGTPRLNVALDLASEHDSSVFLPAAVGICVIALFLMLRSFRGVLSAMVAVGVSATWTVGLMAMTGHSLNVVTIIMPTLHFVLGLSNGIRLVSRFNINFAEKRDVTEAIESTLNQLFLPLLFMTITMVVGFMALLTSDLAPIRELGLFSAIGLIIAFLSNIFIVPGILAAGSPRIPEAAKSGMEHWSARSGEWAVRHRYGVLTLSFILILVCTLLIPKIETESNVLNFFPPESEVQMDYEFIGRRLTGYYTLEVEVEADEQKGYALIDGLKKLEHDALGIPGIVRVDHIGKMDALQKILARGPPDRTTPSPFAGLAERFYYESDGVVAMRFCVLVNTMRSSEFYPLVAKLRKSADKHFPVDTAIRFTGIVSLLNQSQSALVETQVRSFATAFGIIIVMIGFLFRSPLAALASILPNIVPLLLTFAWMSLRRIPLDAATVMIASVAIGIAVDNTIYFLARYGEERERGASVEDAVRATFNTIGKPILFTSLVAAAGFAILTLAGFQPIAYFGLLTAITMLTALAGTLFIAPACVSVLKLWEKKGEPCTILTATR